MHQSIVTGHGHIEERSFDLIAIAVGKDDKLCARRKDLNALVATGSHRLTTGEDTWNSRPEDRGLELLDGGRAALGAARGVWGGPRATAEPKRAGNFPVVCRLVASLLRREKAKEWGTKSKRLNSAFDPYYLYAPQL